MSLWCSKKEKFFKFFFSDFEIRIMVFGDLETYCCINGFLKWSISQKFALLIWETKEKDLCKGNHEVLMVKEDRKGTRQDYN